VPRHREIPGFTAERIFKQLGVHSGSDR
jgi:hypothetical protein